MIQLADKVCLQHALRSDDLTQCRYLSLYWGAAFFDAPDSAPPGEHSLGLRAQRLYDAFSAHMRNVAPVILPLARPPSAEGASTGAAAAGAAAAGAEPRRRWWGGRGSKRMAPASTKADKPGSKSRHAATGSGAQVVGDFISDKQWGSGPPSKTAAGGGKSSRGRNKIIAKLRSSSATDLSVMRPAGSSPPPSPHPSGARLRPHQELGVCAGSIVHCRFSAHSTSVRFCVAEWCLWRAALRRG